MNEATSPAVPRRSLVHGVEAAVCQRLGIARLRQKSALKAWRPSGEADLADLAYRVIAANWTPARAAEQRDRSHQNWRWTIRPRIDPSNRSPEVILERAVAAACAATDNSDWANQIPVASGLVPGHVDRRRAIDLAQRRGEHAYELIELKIGDKTPLYAAVQLLGYASLWLLARREPPKTRPELLGAERIDLRVLAPAAFYAPST